MSSNIKVQRICQYCHFQFIAKTTVTQFCSDTCAKKAYKARKREEKLQQSDKETLQQQTHPLQIIKSKDFLTVKDASVLLNCSIRAIYRLIENKTIKAVKLSERKTTIRRLDIENIFEMPKMLEVNKKKEIKYSLSECYSISEIQEKFNISEKALYELIKRNKIPKIKQGVLTYIPKPLIEQLFN
jgi:excisionase family DNA binding protein